MQKHYSLRDIALLLPMAALLGMGCGNKEAEKEELVPEVAFTFDYPAMVISVDSAQVAGPGMYVELDSALLAQAAQANHYAPSQLSGFTFTKARLHFSSPMNSRYDALRSVELYAMRGDFVAVQVAKLDPVPVGAQTLLLKLSGTDVLDIVRSGQARLMMKMRFDGPVPPVTGHVLVLGAQVKVHL